MPCRHRDSGDSIDSDDSWDSRDPSCERYPAPGIVRDAPQAVFHVNDSSKL